MTFKIKLLILFSFIIINNLFCYFQKITISAIGDIMAHDNLQYYALSNKEKYLSLFNKTNKVFLNDDLTIGNLETPICDYLPIKGYPCFNAKSLLLDALSSSGIELISLANNHSLDQGIDGIISTLKEIKKRKIYHAGTGYSAKEAKKPIFLNINGIIIGYISLTCLLNIPQNQFNENIPYVYYISMNDNNRLKELYSLIQETKKKVDLLIISCHTGVEYVSEPINADIIFFRKMIENGADIILGHHPHVLQKVEYYKTSDKRYALIAYSLGNFISAQARYLSGINIKSNDWILDSTLSKTAEGMILQFDVIKYNNKILVVTPRIIPLFNICFTVIKNKKRFTGYQTTFIDEILSMNDKNIDFNNNIKNIKKLVQYRKEKMIKLINFPFKSIK